LVQELDSKSIGVIIFAEASFAPLDGSLEAIEFDIALL
jgi:hypothetical protein